MFCQLPRRMTHSCRLPGSGEVDLKSWFDGVIKGSLFSGTTTHLFILGQGKMNPKNRVDGVDIQVLSFFPAQLLIHLSWAGVLR